MSHEDRKIRRLERRITLMEEAFSHRLSQMEQVCKDLGVWDQVQARLPPASTLVELITDLHAKRAELDRQHMERVEAILNRARKHEV